MLWSMCRIVVSGVRFHAFEWQPFRGGLTGNLWFGTAYNLDLGIFGWPSAMDPGSLCTRRRRRRLVESDKVVRVDAVGTAVP